MLKKFSLILLILVISTLALAQGVMNFAPKSANVVAVFENNSQNYSALKKAPLFSFLLDDLGIESLIKSSVSQTALSINTKTSQIWNAIQNDFVIFGKRDMNSKSEFSVAAVFKSNSNMVMNLLSSFIGGNLGTQKINDVTFKTFEANGLTIYALDHDEYVLLSNSPNLIIDSVNSYDGKSPSFKAFGNVPSDSWFSIYFKDEFSKDSTSDVIPKDMFTYGKVKGNSLSITGVSEFEYKNKTLKSKILSFKSNAKSLETTPATGDFWVAADVADPVELYKLVKNYAKGWKTDKLPVLNEKEVLDLVGHMNGKVFMYANAGSSKEDYVASVYLSKDISKYIPNISKTASATFKWQGHTVLRNDTVEGTRTTSDYTIFYQDKVIFSNMAPEDVSKYLKVPTKAEDVGNYSSFSNQVWNNAFVIGYVDIGNIIENALQYTLKSGAIFQAKTDSNADFVWQLILR